MKPFPGSEDDTLFLYRLVQDRLGWRLSHIQVRFPDVIMENERGQKLTAEFEYLAGNFKLHKHNPDGCDLIICWKNNWPDCPIPVWELCNHPAILEILPLIQAFSSGIRSKLEVLETEVSRLNSQARGLANRVKSLEFDKNSPGNAKRVLGITSDVAIRGIGNIWTDEPDLFSKLINRTEYHDDKPYLRLG